MFTVLFVFLNKVTRTNTIIVNDNSDVYYYSVP